jgi:hypothetical protein
MRLLLLFIEVIKIDMNTKTIENLFYKQIRELTLKSKIESFDRQFNDVWL